MIHEHDRRTDRRTPHDGYSRAYAYHRAAKMRFSGENFLTWGMLQCMHAGQVGQHINLRPNFEL